MKPANVSKEPSFFQLHIRPLLVIFLIPAFSAWFFPYAAHEVDAAILAQAATEIESNHTLTPAQKERVLDYYRKNPVSELLASSDPERAKGRAMFESVETRYALFRWMSWVAWACLATILATFLIVGTSVAFSFRSQSAQYHALRIGWPVLQASAVTQVVGQGILCVALSYWVTAIWTHSYYPKLILIAGVFAFFGVVALIKAIFMKAQDLCEVEGDIVLDTDAPGLWERVREMSAKLKIAPPDRIIVGIDPNFFVTEHPVNLAGELHHGRTLYLSLPMLKVLRADEADVILGHELAHFHGNDTLWGRKVSPLTKRFRIYLHMLSGGYLSIVRDFMHFFWRLYGLSIQKLSRTREFRADYIGAKLVSAEAARRALIKTTAYCEYRSETENAVLQKGQVDKELDLARLLEEGYPSFMTAFTGKRDAINQTIPHPFDSHPPLENRLKRLGFDAQAALQDAELHAPVEDSWHRGIATATALEEKLWAGRQEKIQSVHGQVLAWKLSPKSEEDVAVVLRHFPKTVYRARNGDEVTLEYDRVFITGWKATVFFKDVIHVAVHDTLTTKQVLIISQKEGEKKQSKVRFHSSKYKGKGELLAVFAQYYNRHKNAETAIAEAASVDEGNAMG